MAQYIVLGHFISLAQDAPKISMTDILRQKGGDGLEITKIGADAFKLRIGKSELTQYGLNFAALDRRDIKTRMLLEQAVIQIEAEHRMRYRLEDLVTEFFPDQNGGCFLYLNGSKGRAQNKKEQQICCWVFDSLQDFERCPIAIPEKTPVYLYNDMCFIPKGKKYCPFEFAQPICFDETVWPIFLEYAKTVK